MDGHNQRDKPQANVQHRVLQAGGVVVLRAADARGRQVRLADVHPTAHVLHAPPEGAERAAV